MRDPHEYWPVALATLLVVAAPVVVVWPGASAAPTPETSDPGADVSFDPPVVRDPTFDAPTQDGVARVDGERYGTVRAALDAAAPGDTVRLRGRFDETVTVETPNVTLAGAGPNRTLLHGPGEGDVLTLAAPNVTVHGLWVRNAGFETSENDAAVWVEGDGTTFRDGRVTRTTFGIWVNGSSDVRLVDNTVVGRESVTPLTDRGNGIQLWYAHDAYVAGNRITDVRDGIYYSWASDVVAERNAMWDLRYGVHFMYSDRCVLRDNLAFDGDVGYALMVSQHLTLVNNTAVNNTGQSGHGVLVKSIDDSHVVGNDLVANDNGLFLYNSLNNTVTGNLVLANDVGVHVSAGSVRERVHSNSFVRNDRPVLAELGEQVSWNGSARGNYWSGATTADTDADGVSETRYRPAGLVEHLLSQAPGARVFADSPAFAVVRTAERTVPLVESPGVVDRHPLVRPPHEDWRRYYAHDSDD